MAVKGIDRSVSPQVTGDPRWAAVRKVADSSHFLRAAFLRDFLFYIAENELSRHPEEITEQKIGHRVYRRNEVYSPADDNIVRVSANQLRAKLREFYETEGKDEPWIIEIPKGKYVPVFHERAAHKIEAPLGAPKRVTASAGRWLFAVAIITVAEIFAATRLYHPKPGLANPAVAPNLITLIFHDSTDPVEVVQSDEALTLMQSILGRRITFEEYTSQSYKQSPPAFRGNQQMEGLWHVLSMRQIINVGDAGVSTRIRDSLSALGPTPLVRIHSAQNMRPRDFLSGNFILLGDSSSDPWVQMFGESRFNFQFDPDISHFPRHILNVHPKAGELGYYAADPSQNLSYARIAYIPNVTNTGRVLLIAGTTMEGTEAAADFCLQPDSVLILRHDLGIGNVKELPAFEVLLATSAEGGTGIEAHLVSARASGSPSR
jgi:hypothetical protein